VKPWLVVDSYTEGDAAGNFCPHLDGPVTVVRAASGRLPLSPRPHRGVIVTGSAAGVNDRLPWVQQTVDFVRRAVAQDVPVLGVCFGHQVLAEAVIGPRAIRRSPRPEVGWFRIHVDRPSPILAGFPAHFQTFLSHFDEVRPAVAHHLDVIASSARCPIQAFQVPGRRAWGVQFHAEMGPAETRRIVHRYVGSRVPGQPARALQRATDSRRIIAGLLDNFTRATASG